MRTVVFFLCSLFLILSGCTNKTSKSSLTEVNRENLIIYPDVSGTRPEITSPVIDENGREYVLFCLDGNKYSWVDATMENGEAFNYKEGKYGKGNQNLPDELDFPHFAQHGIHSGKELSSCLSITGRSVSHITVDGRPWASSGVGFLADEETILSVIWGDNKIVRKMGLTHPDIARPLFHVVNGSGMMGKLDAERIQEVQGYDVSRIIYNDKEISYDITGSRGWQESIFDDEILGSGHIHMWGTVDEEDLLFLDDHYKDLSAEHRDSLKNMLSHIHTGNMVLYYITRYGFYEGRNEYKPDPLVVAYMFGLRTIEEIHEASGGNLFTYLTTPNTENPPFKDVRRKTKDGRKGITLDMEKPITSTPQPATRNPQPATRNPQRATRNPQPATIDSLVSALAAAGRHWNEPAGELIAIGDPAVPALVELLFDKNQSQWSRRVAAMTLNQIRSPLTVEPALKLLFDKDEDWGLRNQIIPSLRGFDLSAVKDELWETFNSTQRETYWGNIADLLRTADTALAYQAYHKLYIIRDGYGKRTALQNLASLRPHEATYWYLQGLQTDDWMTGNVAMDSLVSIKNLDEGLLIELYDNDKTTEETRWRIIHVLGQLNLPDTKMLLEKASKDTSWLIRMESLYYNL